jgi:hypothetical protein
MTNKLNLVQINTTAWDEEDFLLVTSLTEDQIKEVIEPIVLAEREVVNGDVMYYNEDYVHLLQQQYPSATIIHYNPNEIDLISI